MKKKRKYMLYVYSFLVAFLCLAGNANVSAKEGNAESSGQTSVIFISGERQSVNYIPKEKEKGSQKEVVNTGDTTSKWKYIRMVITSLFILMFIIKKNKNKGEMKNEIN